MADTQRRFNWNGGSSNTAASGTPGFSTSAPAATSIELIPGHYLHGFSAYNLASVPLFVQLFDGVSVPAAAAVPLRTYPIASTGALTSTGLGEGVIDVEFGTPRYFSAGIVIALSSLAACLSLASVGTMILDCQYQ